MLTIEETTESGVVTLTLRGELDPATAPPVDDAIAAAVAKARLGVVVRISTLDFIGAAGLRSLEQGQQLARATGRSFLVIADSWQLKIASVVPDLKLTISLVEGPQGWTMRALAA